MNDQVDKKFSWTEGIILAFVPALAYLFAFSYELGFAGYFNIPMELIHIDLPQLVFLMFLMFFIFSIMIAPLDLLLFSIPKKNQLVFAKAKILLPIIVIAILSTIRYGWRLNIVTYCVLTFIAFLQLGFPLITQRSTNGYANKLKAQDELEVEIWKDKSSISDLLYKKIGRNNLLMGVNIFLISLILSYVGAIQASKKIDFYTTGGDPTKVVLRIYNDKMILGELDRKSKAVRPKFSIVSISEASNVTFSFEEVGPLHPLDDV